MNTKLFIQALTKFLAGLLLVGVLLFVPAGTFAFWQAWLFIALPLVLASLWSFLIMLLYIPIIAKRIRNEDAVLEQGLEGYKEYKERVKYKVIPFLW